MALRHRVGTLCHLIRLAAVGWIAWALAVIVMKWSDMEALKSSWGHYLKLDLSTLPPAHYAAAVTVILIDWLVSAFVVVFVWRLFGCYLRGSIFSLEAVDEMRKLGWAGVAAVCADMIARPLIQTLLSWHLGAGSRSFSAWAEPNDVLHLLMALFVVAIAHIFRTGVEIADDNRQII